MNLRLFTRLSTTSPTQIHNFFTGSRHHYQQVLVSAYERIKFEHVSLENQQAETELVEVVAAFALDRLCLRQAQAAASF